MKVRRVVKGTFNINPPMPRYTDIWDVDVVLRSLAKSHPPNSLTDYELSVKCCTLLSILSLSRVSTVSALGPEFQLVDDEVVLPIRKLEKNSKAGG